MKASDLQTEDLLDLENLGLPGATGVTAECECAVVELYEDRQVFTDLVNLRVPSGNVALEPSPNGGWRFCDPQDVQSWTW